MNKFSGLSDELLIKILTYLPTKDAVSTSALSKQWEFLWMWLPNLEYGDRNYSESEWKMLRSFLHRNLPLHRAPVLERVLFEFPSPDEHEDIKPQDVKMWVMAVVSRCLHELDISYSSFDQDDILPSNLYICKSLVTLNLDGEILMDVPRMVCLPCLKALQLIGVTYVDQSSLPRLLSNCPVLEDLYVGKCGGDNMRHLTVIVPSLLRLVLNRKCDLNAIVINTACLKYLELHNTYSTFHYCLIENMPNLIEACLSVGFLNIEKVMRSITSVKRLTLCLRDSFQQAMYGVDFNINHAVYADGFFFNKLVHLKLCICQWCASTVFTRLLQDSPNLRKLVLFEMDHHDSYGLRVWNEPSIVPKCMMSSLQTFKFSGYLGRPQERALATFILRNSPHLKTATILSKDGLIPTLDMLKELALSPRASTTCQLVFE